MPNKFLTVGKAGLLGAIKFIAKHWYSFVVLIVILPTILSSISLAIEEKNPIIPFAQLGIHLANADAVISKDVDTLREDPAILVGMENPEVGIWANIKYGWFFFWRVIYRFIGNIFLISVPFIFFYKLFRLKGSKGTQSSTLHDLVTSIFWALLFIFIVNLVILIHGLMSGSSMLTIPENMNFFAELLFIVKNVLPFHGVGKLIAYLIGLL